jgi:CBS domain-containing protein
MNVKDVCSVMPETILRIDSVEDAARRMRNQGVGTMVVTDADRRVEGIVTDRDIVTRCVADGLPVDSTTVADVMSTEVVTVRDETPIEDALRTMAEEVVRRLVVVDADDRAIGVLSLDDVIDGILSATDEIGRIIRRQVYT